MIQGRILSAILAIILICSAGIGCNKKPSLKGMDTPPSDLPEFCAEYNFDIISLPYKECPSSNFSQAAADDTTYPVDTDGVFLFKWNDQFYYHPVEMCHKAYIFLAAYRQTGDSTYLSRIKSYTRRMMMEAIPFGDAVYFPYRFDYKVHGRDDGLLKAPWFSGMAQGEALLVFGRAFSVTGDSTYLDFAHKIFNSFGRLKGEAEPWTVFADKAGCYWIEEYPLPEPSMTLNGFIFALYGVYDYYLLTGSTEAADVLRDSFRTLKNYIPHFRRPGRPSFYGLRFGHYTASYHLVHINQLRYLEKMTGDHFFGDWADSLYLDYSG
ncbi:MAG: D-glucuronyl C5-epimerase family protein [Candidatus Zixiibacteriota bacterium]